MDTDFEREKPYLHGLIQEDTRVDLEDTCDTSSVFSGFHAEILLRRPKAMRETIIYAWNTSRYSLPSRRNLNTTPNLAFFRSSESNKNK